MNRRLRICAGLAACAGLGACAVPPGPNDLTQQTVQYNCEANGPQALTAQYFFRGEEPVSTRITFQGQVIELARDLSDRHAPLDYTFRGNGYTWTTDSFTGERSNRTADGTAMAARNEPTTTGTGPAANPPRPDTGGSMLTREVPQTVNGQTTMANMLVANYCRAIGTYTPAAPPPPVVTVPR